MVDHSALVEGLKTSGKLIKKIESGLLDMTPQELQILKRSYEAMRKEVSLISQSLKEFSAFESMIKKSINFQRLGFKEPVVEGLLEMEGNRAAIENIAKTMGRVHIRMKRAESANVDGWSSHDALLKHGGYAVESFFKHLKA